MPIIPFQIQNVVDLLQSTPIIFPTETVFGVAATLDKISLLYHIKKRPDYKPLPLMVHSIEEAQKIIKIPQQALPYLEELWPGPLTLVGPAINTQAASLMNTTSLAVRIPDSSILLSVLKEIQEPLAVTSANISGNVSATRYHLLDKTLIKNLPCIEQTNPSRYGLESTVVSFTHNAWTVLRLGATTLDSLQHFANTNYTPPKSSPLIHWNTPPEKQLCSLGFGPLHPAEQNLSCQGDIWEAAFNLYACLSSLPKQGPLYVAPLPNHSLSLSIIDSLSRIFHA